jgi:hypothetical protein
MLPATWDVHERSRCGERPVTFGCKTISKERKARHSIGLNAHMLANGLPCTYWGRVSR